MSDGATPVHANPGELGLQLLIIKNFLRDLGNSDALPAEERAALKGFYSHQRDKVQIQIGILDRKERIESCEKALQFFSAEREFAESEAGRNKARLGWQKREAGKALGGGGGPGGSSGRGQAENDYIAQEVSEAKNRYSKGEGDLRKFQSELEALSCSLEALGLDDAKWEAHKTMARQWESSRSWEAITPDELQAAVAALRKSFDSNAWKCAQSTEKMCFAALHPPLRTEAAEAQDLSPYKNLLIAYLGSQIERMFLGSKHPPSAIFKSYSDVYMAALNVVSWATFRELLEVATARSSLLNMNPVEWAEIHTQMLISNEQFTFRMWIRAVCDKQDRSESASGGIDTEEAIYWGSFAIQTRKFMSGQQYPSRDLGSFKTRGSGVWRDYRTFCTM